MRSHKANKYSQQLLASGIMLCCLSVFAGCFQWLCSIESSSLGLFRSVVVVRFVPLISDDYLLKYACGKILGDTQPDWSNLGGAERYCKAVKLALPLIGVSESRLIHHLGSPSDEFGKEMEIAALLQKNYNPNYDKTAIWLTDDSYRVIVKFKDGICVNAQVWSWPRLTCQCRISCPSLPSGR
jgi:hypothetical protein